MACKLEIKIDVRTDFEIELARIDEGIAALETEAEVGPLNIEKTTRLLYGLHQRASLTNKFAEFEATEHAIDRAIQRFGPWPDICFLKASLDLKFHQLAKVKRDLNLAPELASSPSAKVLQADLDFQEGRYEVARLGFERAIEENRSWDILARFAHFCWKLGDETRAEKLYFEAEEEITVKEARCFAWVELQRGLLDFARGRYEETAVHYARAAETYTGYWLVDEHRAELLGAEGRFADAISLYKAIVAHATKPELKQAVGELYLLMGNSTEAELWQEAALRDYLCSVERGHVHYFHHLTDFYSDVRVDGKEAVKWARRDLELRPNVATKAALAWALYRDAQIAEAFDLINQSLACGAQDAHLFYRAGMIYLAAGHTREGEVLFERAAEVNFRYEAFHVHH
jgi:tetratricopeptide (TPR) repeat protein